MINTPTEAEYIYRLDGNVPGSWEKPVTLRREELAGVKSFRSVKGTIRRLEMGTLLTETRGKKVKKRADTVAG